jgi:predicted nucleic-acid-binding Zn-ribbon protein
LRYLLTLLLSALIFAACKPKVQECFVPKSVSANIAFGLIDTFIELDTANIPITKVRIVDTALYFPIFESIEPNVVQNVRFEGLYNSTQMGIFLNPDNDSTQYIFYPNLALFDTFKFHYESYPHFISNDCGYTYFYKLKKVSHTTRFIDSVLISNPEVTNSAQRSNVTFYIID